jgi:hypothetical protein
MTDEAKVRSIRDYDADYARLVERGGRLLWSSHGKMPGASSGPPR